MVETKMEEWRRCRLAAQLNCQLARHETEKTELFVLLFSALRACAAIYASEKCHFSSRNSFSCENRVLLFDTNFFSWPSFASALHKYS